MSARRQSFPYPDVPIIMLTAHGERSRVVEAVRLGVNEFLIKPVSSTALLTRLVSIFAKPWAMVKKGDYYGSRTAQDVELQAGVRSGAQPDRA